MMKGFFLPKALDTTANEDYCVDYKKGYISTEPHWHDCSEIIYNIKGKATVFFVNKRYELKENEMIFVPPGRVHCFECDHTNERITLGIKNNMLAINPGTEKDFTLPFLDNKTEAYCIMELNEKTHKCFENLVAYQEEASPIRTLLSHGEILKIFAYVYSIWSDKGVVLAPNQINRNIALIRKTIEENLQEPPTAEEMAKMLSISYSYMHKLLRKHLNMSYNELINYTRVEVAKRLLLATDTNVTDICLHCGFCTSSYFAKIFKRYTGVTPKKFRGVIIK